MRTERGRGFGELVTVVLMCALPVSSESDFFLALYLGLVSLPLENAVSCGPAALQTVPPSRFVNDRVRIWTKVCVTPKLPPVPREGL